MYTNIDVRLDLPQDLIDSLVAESEYRGLEFSELVECILVDYTAANSVSNAGDLAFKIEDAVSGRV